MSWFQNEEKDARTKKLQYQEELKAQMRQNEEALEHTRRHDHAAARDGEDERV